MKTNLFRAGFGALVIATPAIAEETGMASSHTLRKEGGRLCMADHAHSGSGSGATKEAARVQAIKSWSEFTAFEYGSNWARYGRSSGQKTGYTKEEKGWTATVEGRPCK